MKECKFFYTDNTYCCMIKKKKECCICNVEDEWSSRYCQGQYKYCPYYKDFTHEHKKGCYITTACVDSMQLGDECHELVVLREFRDVYLKSTDMGREHIYEYYDLAPIIVKKINTSSNPAQVYSKIYYEMILPCVDLIDSYHYEEAYNHYQKYTKYLEHMYS